MNELISLFSQYSLETIILFVVSIGIALKAVGGLWEYFYDKIRKHFDVKTNKEKQHSEITEGIDRLENKITGLEERFDILSKEIARVKVHLANNTERLQENTRSYIIDKHHYFVYKVKAIDDLNLQSLERRYLYYKTAGGDSFIDGLMEEIRDLPKVNLQDSNIVEVIQHHGF